MLILLTVFSCVPLCRGQVGNLYPDSFSGFFHDLSLVNPAHIPENTKGLITGGIKFRTGVFRKVATHSFSASRIFRKGRRSQLIRGRLYNEKEGPYINKPRAYFNYAYELPLFRGVKMSAGGALGFGSVFYAAPSATGQGSVLLPDGEIGITLKSEKYYGGASVKQMLNNTSESVAASVRLRRYGQFFFQREFMLDYNWQLRGIIHSRVMPSRENNHYITAILGYKETFYAGSVLRLTKGPSFAGYFKTGVGENNDKLLVSYIYNTSTPGGISSRFQSMELRFSYFFK